MEYIGIDLGGTNIAAGIVREDGSLLHQDSIPTGSGGNQAIVDRIVILVEKILNNAGKTIKDIKAVGIGVPGTANQDSGFLEYANNLGMENEPFLEMLRPYFPKTRLAFENDANAAAWAEYKLGAGKGVSSMIMVTLGTGIGGGIIWNDRLYEGINYAAGEFGHFIIQYDGLPCNCGRKGCFERYASAAALVEQTVWAMKQHPESVLWEMCGRDLLRIDGKMFFKAVEKKDATAIKVLDTYTDYLSCGFLDIINIFQPELICVGGGISKAGELLIAPIRRRMEKESYTRMSGRQPEIVAASLGNEAGIIGAALLAAKE